MTNEQALKIARRIIKYITTLNEEIDSTKSTIETAMRSDMSVLHASEKYAKLQKERIMICSMWAPQFIEKDIKSQGGDKFNELFHHWVRSVIRNNSEDLSMIRPLCVRVASMPEYEPVTELDLRWIFDA